MKKLILIIPITLLFASCSKKDPSLSESSAPFIKIISVTPTVIHEFKDSINILIEYSDINGDVGSTNPDVNDMAVKDSRLPKPDYYFVPPLSPPGSDIKIKGQMNIRIKNTFLIGAGGNENMTYELQLKDNAGNYSNTAVTPQLTITK
ncbi:MAG: hypothetical protein H7321_03130 [Bacteroidia bacterium]|nr:hypothetical protein [Bacteroidia bacterium]